LIIPGRVLIRIIKMMLKNRAMTERQATTQLNGE
jgi:hypothetical protein